MDIEGKKPTEGIWEKEESIKQVALLFKWVLKRKRLYHLINYQQM